MTVTHGVPHCEADRTSPSRFGSLQSLKPRAESLGILARFPRCDLQKRRLQRRQTLLFRPRSNRTPADVDRNSNALRSDMIQLAKQKDVGSLETPRV